MRLEGDREKVGAEDGSEGKGQSWVEEKAGAPRTEPSEAAAGGAGWGLGREVLTVESLKDVPGRKGRPCTGLDTISAAFAAAT